jgi:predicted secreted protein
MAITGKVGAVYILDPEAESVVFASGAQECTGCPERIRYCVAPALRYLDPDKPVTVFRNDVPIDSGFHIEHIGGCVVFDEPQGELDGINLLASYYNLADIKQAGGCFNWSLNAEVEEKDVTTFKSAQETGGWKSFIGLLKGWSASAEAYWGDENFFAALGKRIILRLFVDAGPSQDCFEGYAIVTSEDISTAVDEIVEESIDFRGSGLLSAIIEE